MKVLVTGGAGYVGSTLVPSLINIGHEVTVVDNFMYNQTPLLDLVYLGKRFLGIVRKDYRKLDKDFLSQFNAVIHLACLTGAPASQENASSWSINSEGVSDFLDKLPAEAKVIFPCTNSGYGVGSADLLCTEATPLNPLSHYGKQKVEAEKDVLSFGGISLRFATLFGASPRMRLDLLVNDFVYRAVTDKVVVLFESHFKRNYVHVRDACESIRHCLNNFDLMRANVYNVGLSDANLSKLELAKKIKQHIPELAIFESDVNKDPDQRNYIVSNEKIERTGWKALTTLDMGITELIQTYEIVRRNQYSNL